MRGRSSNAQGQSCPPAALMGSSSQSAPPRWAKWTSGCSLLPPSTPLSQVAGAASGRARRDCCRLSCQLQPASNASGACCSTDTALLRRWPVWPPPGILISFPCFACFAVLPIVVAQLRLRIQWRHWEHRAEQEEAGEEAEERAGAGAETEAAGAEADAAGGPAGVQSRTDCPAAAAAVAAEAGQAPPAAADRQPSKAGLASPPLVHQPTKRQHQHKHLQRMGIARASGWAREACICLLQAFSPNTGESRHPVCASHQQKIRAAIC